MTPLTAARWPWALALLGMAALVLGACSDDDGDDRATSSTTATTQVSQEAAAKLKLVQPGRLTACTDPTRPPFSFEASGQLDGIEPELVRGLGGRFALTGDPVRVGAGEALSALDAGRCDVAAIAVTEEAKKAYLLSEPYLLVRQSLLVRAADAERYKELDALRGRAVGVQAGTAGAGLAREIGGGATVQELATVGELFAALEAGRVDAVVHDLPVNAYRASTGGGTVVTKVFDDEDGRPHALAVPKGRTDLKKVLDDALVQVKSDDTYPTVLRRFLGDFAAQALRDVGGRA